MQPETRLHTVPDDELLRRLGELVSQSRRVEADLVAHIGEVDARGLYARQAFPSMFAYCTEALHLSEAEAYRRITVARASRKHALLLPMLRDGRLHLSGIALLAPLLTPENREALIERATHRSKREIEKLVAELQPRPDAPSVMRKLPEPRKAPLSGASQERAPGPGAALELVPGRVGTAAPAAVPSFTPSAASATPPVFAIPVAFAAPASPSRPAVVEPLSPARYKVQFTASAELHDKLERLAALMRSEVPSGDLAAVIERAVSETLERLEARRYAQTRAPRKTLAETDASPASRHIPAAVRRAVRERDGERCRYVDEQGRRCSARDRLEFHHLHPFGMGGDHSPGNIRLLCSRHNRYLAEHDYGKAAIRRPPAVRGRSSCLSGSQPTREGSLGGRAATPMKEPTGRGRAIAPA
jgi:5-methylcytosine-specific restriction endonuclease McrA